MPRQPHRAGRLPGGHELITIAEETDAFNVRRRDGLAALNYAYVTGDADQFAWPRAEMRGLIVDEASGEVIARPFHKFWNFNEEGARGTDWSEAHVVLPKLDGSLVYPAGGRWVTRGGVTDTSMRAERLATRIGAPLAHLLDAGLTDPDDGERCTPCFEYVGPDNRIVVHYGTSRLVLLAVRRICDGRYWPTQRVIEAFDRSGAQGDPRLAAARPLQLRTTGTTGEHDPQELTAEVQRWSGENEGVVVAFEPSGHRIKIKSLDYTALHRARDDYSSESRILTVWSNGDGEKLVSNLSDERARRLATYYEQLERAIDDAATRIAGEAAQHWLAHDGVRKNAAISWTMATAERIPVRTAGFTVFNALTRNENAADAARRHILKAIEKACRNTSAIQEKVKPLLGTAAPTWKPPDGNDGDSDQ